MSALRFLLDAPQSLPARLLAEPFPGPGGPGPPALAGAERAAGGGGKPGGCSNGLRAPIGRLRCVA